MQNRIGNRRAEALLAAVIIARAMSLLIVKSCLGDFQIFNLMALRFHIAFVCLVPFVWPHLRRMRRSTLYRGGLLGALFFLIIAVELKGLRMTASSATVSFLENTAIVLVPLGEALLHRRLPRRQNLFSALLALTGVGFLLLRDGHMELTAGVQVCMLCALLYSCYIILTDRLSHRDDPLLLGFLAIGTVGILSTVSTYATEAPRLPQTGTEWAGMLLLAVVCGSIGTALQPVAQRDVPSEAACVFCALNPLATCVTGWLFLGEWQGLTGLIGALLILSAIVFSRMRLSGRRHAFRTPGKAFRGLRAQA